MAITKDPQKEKKRTTETERSEFVRSLHGRVWQDTYALKRVRTASGQPQPSKKPDRTDGMDTNSDRKENLFDDTRRVHKAIWVRKPISLLIDHQAALWGVSPSRAGERLIEAGLEHNILKASTDLLVKAMRETLIIECRRFFARITAILFRIYVLLAQVLHLQKNLLARSGYQKRLTPEDLDKIISWSRSQAKDDVVKGTRRGDMLDQAVEAWLDEIKPADERQAPEGMTQSN
jgi:hypothetical protein